METMIPLTVKIILDKESSDAPYIAYNPELDIASCALTEEKARRNLKAAVKIFMDEMQKKNKLTEVLHELGFQKEDKRWIPPTVSFESFYFPSLA